jgi:hypothetical protein
MLGRLAAYRLAPVVLAAVLAVGGTVLVTAQASGKPGSVTIREDAVTVKQGTATPDAQTLCSSADDTTTCLQTTGTGLVVGNMVGRFTNDGRKNFDACVQVFGPAGFSIRSSCQPLPKGISIEVGWDQHTKSVGGFYCALGYSDSHGKIKRFGAERCIWVHS